MGKAKINEKHTISVEGTLNIDGNEIIMEVEDVGDKKLSDLLAKFQGCYVKITAGYAIEIDEK